LTLSLTTVTLRVLQKTTDDECKCVTDLQWKYNGDYTFDGEAKYKQKF